MTTKNQVTLNLLGLTNIDPENSQQLMSAYRSYKEAKDVLAKFEKDVLKPSLFSHAEKYGKQDEKGSSAVTFEDGTGWQRQAKWKVSVDNEEAVSIMQEKALFEYIDEEETIPAENMETVIRMLKQIGREDLIDVSKSVSPESLEQAFYAGQIKDEDLQRLVKREVTYALVEVKPKKAKK